MKVVYSFGDESNKELDALIELQLINDIITNNLKINESVSKELVDRCLEIKRSLIEFPKVIQSINSFSELIDDPWKYEKLIKSSYYKNKSSVRLTDSDRLVFEEEVIPLESGELIDCLIIIETMFHYIKDIKVDILKSDPDRKIDLALYQLIDSYGELPNYSKIVDSLYEKSKTKEYEGKIWLFDDSETVHNY